MAKNEVPVGENITVEVVGNIAVIRVDLTQRLRLSGSGKNTVVATTGAPTTIPGTNVKLGLNVFTK